MADNLPKTGLARQAKALARSRGCQLPSLVFLTDDERIPDPLPSIRALPRDSMVVVRARDRARRHELAVAVAALARARGLLWIVAGDPALAEKTGADGVHFPESRIAEAARWRVRRPSWLITCAAHSLASCARSVRARADAIFLAPVFATESHPARACLGVSRARLIAGEVALPLYALGGIDARSARRLSGARFCGLAAVGALAVGLTQE